MEEDGAKITLILCFPFFHFPFFPSAHLSKLLSDCFSIKPLHCWLQLMQMLLNQPCTSSVSCEEKPLQKVQSCVWRGSSFISLAFVFVPLRLGKNNEGGIRSLPPWECGKADLDAKPPFYFFLDLLGPAWHKKSPLTPTRANHDKTKDTPRRGHAPSSWPLNTHGRSKTGCVSLLLTSAHASTENCRSLAHMTMT